MSLVPILKRFGNISSVINALLSTDIFFGILQDELKKMRVMDDKITQALNTSIPTESFAGKVDPTSACKDLFTRVSSD